ncbi:oxidoreductase [Streptomyces sp. NPDC052043]|uniref:oxidoreductase n=1 Tax=Streptomyces sp. NPDC052043 TaxID=3365684 RepID=UPI0037D95088
MHSYEELSASERELWDAYPTGRLVDLRAGESEDDPEAGDGWGVDRTIRATVVAALLRGAHPGEPGTAPALRLKGARISGALDLSHAEIGHGLWFEGCWFEHGVSFHGAATRSISMNGSRVPGFDLTTARVEGRVELRDTVVHGRLSLLNARIVGELVLSRATLTQPDDWAMFAGGLVVEGGLFCRRATVHGGMRLLGARLSGGLHMEGARIHHPGAVALIADNATVTTLALSEGFTVHGAISLRGTQISDHLNLDGATLDSAGTALDCTQMRAGVFAFTPAEAPSGLIDLRGAQVLTVRDRLGAWPGTVRLQGFTYGALAEEVGSQPSSAKDRVAWICRDPGYAGQPYEQLAGWYRRIGHDDDARRVLLARQRRRRRTLSRPARIWGHLLDATVGYGYRPWLAGVWLAALAVFGTVVFSANTPLPTQQGQTPPFHAFVYTLDLLIPVGGLGQRSAWYWTGATAWLAYAFIAAGWLLTTAVLAGVSRTLNKN